MFGANNATYFSANAFIPDYLHHVGRPAGRAWPYVGCGLLSLFSVIGILSGTGWIIVAAAAALGFSGAATLTLLLALPPLLSPPEDIHRTTAAMFTISCLAWDASGIPAVAFAPIGLFSCLMIGLASTLPRPAR